jgi:hypothetical protein
MTEATQLLQTALRHISTIEEIADRSLVPPGPLYNREEDVVAAKEYARVVCEILDRLLAMALALHPLKAYPLSPASAARTHAQPHFKFSRHNLSRHRMTAGDSRFADPRQVQPGLIEQTSVLPSKV